MLKNGFRRCLDSLLCGAQAWYVPGPSVLVIVRPLRLVLVRSRPSEKEKRGKYVNELFPFPAQGFFSLAQSKSGNQKDSFLLADIHRERCYFFLSTFFANGKRISDGRNSVGALSTRGFEGASEGLSKAAKNQIAIIISRTRKSIK